MAAKRLAVDTNLASGSFDVHGWETRRERAAIAELLRRVRARGWPPLLRAALFGSKARGDFDRNSDVDVLLVCNVPPAQRLKASDVNGRVAEAVTRATGVPVEAWSVCADDLLEGRRTPMLVDAVTDSVPLWPRGAPPLHAPFTPADAVFCASRLLEWVEDGGAVVRAALRDDRWADAAARARDDIARLATSALLLTGDTRHRRVSSLHRFERVFLREGFFPASIRPALAWAAAAYPPDGGRGQEEPPVTAAAVRTAPLGYDLAARMEAELLTPILDRILDLSGWIR